jgi:hypothetical protein
MKRNLQHAISYVLVLLMLAACSNNDFTIKSVVLTDRESILISNAGGASAHHFEFSGQIPEGYGLYFTIEQYENGEFIGNVLYPNPVDLTMKGHLISFSVSGSGEDGKVLYGHTGEVTTMKVDIGTGPSSSGKLFDEKISLKPDEPVYLAFWAAAFGDSMNPIQKDLNGFANIEAIQNQELSFLFKAEIRK